MSMSAGELRILYRNILKKAKVFPSRNQKMIYDEIRTEFRENKNLTDMEKITKCVSVAQKGLQQLAMYTDLPKNASKWSVDLEQNPMPKPSDYGQRTLK